MKSPEPPVIAPEADGWVRLSLSREHLATLHDALHEYRHLFPDTQTGHAEELHSLIGAYLAQGYEW